MSFYIRKSLRAGHLRFNLSKSGIGVSAGFKGFRVGTGPRGNYVHMGRKGLYYRATLPSGGKSGEPMKPKPARPTEPIDSEFSTIEMEEIESVDVLQLQDSSSSDLLAEINSKHNKPRFLPAVALISFIALIVSVFLNAPIWLYAIAIPIIGVALLLVYYRDQLAKTTILFYDLDSEVGKSYQSLHDAFKELAGCSQAWHIASSGKITEMDTRKRQAGADSLVQRKPISLALQAPPYVSTNLSIPSIPVGKQALYFFPDRILVYESKGVGAVSYSDVQLQLNNIRFIEAQGIPPDAQVVDHTWQYVNKKGGPDRRFKNNRQLPIALYSELHFRSLTGLNELIQLSKPNLGSAFANAFGKLALAQG